MGSIGRLHNKVSVITGAASGIGKAVCMRFLQEGAKVILVDKNESLLIETHTLLKEKFPSKVGFASGDVGNESFASDVFSKVHDQFSDPCTVLVNSAGLGISSLVQYTSVEQFDYVVNVNLKGTFIFTKHFLAAFKNKNEICLNLKPSIINVSSLAGKIGMSHSASYAAAKSGVIGFTKSTCLEVAKHGIRCNAVLPGFIDTPLLESINKKYLQASIQMNPMKRLGQPVEVANVCLFLACDESSYVNGASIEVTGGLGA